MNANIMKTQKVGPLRSLKVTIDDLCHTFRLHFLLPPNTFIYESILIKIYMNMYHLKGH